MLDASGGSPLVTTGDAAAVEAAWLLPGGSAWRYELGVRGMASALRPGFLGRATDRELALFGGVELQLLREPGWLDLEPTLRLGLRAGTARDRFVQLAPGSALGQRRIAGPEDRAFVGPHVALGVSRAFLEGARLGLEVGAHGSLAPTSVMFELAVRVSVE